MFGDGPPGRLYIDPAPIGAPPTVELAYQIVGGCSKRSADVLFTSAALWCGFFSEPRIPRTRGPRYLTCRICLRKRHRVARASTLRPAHAGLRRTGPARGKVGRHGQDGRVTTAPIGQVGPALSPSVKQPLCWLFRYERGRTKATLRFDHRPREFAFRSANPNLTKSRRVSGKRDSALPAQRPARRVLLNFSLTKGRICAN